MKFGLSLFFFRNSIYCKILSSQWSVFFKIKDFTLLIRGTHVGTKLPFFI